jgi:hypothetical protein
MNKIYDNGTILLGTIYNVKEYLCRHCEDLEDIKDLIEDLENYDANSIVAINYDCGMGYSIDYWHENDIVKEYEENERN